MDPQKLSQLDPKLRDAYQRVMGTPLPPMPAPDPTSVPQPEPMPPPPPAEPDSIPAGGSAPTIQEPPLQPPVSEPESVFSPISEPLTEPQPAINPQPEVPPVGGPTPEPAIPQQQNSNFAPVNFEASTAPIVANPVSPNFAAPAPIQPQTMAIKKKGGRLTPVMTGIAILVFIVVYTLFWTKIFNFKLP